MRHFPFLACMAISLFLQPASATEPSSRAIHPDTLSVADGDNQFAIDLYKRLARNGGNLFCSPESISTALAQAYAGARGETAAEMARVLHFSLPAPRLHSAFSELIAACRSTRPDCVLHSANALWCAVDAQIIPEYIAMLKRHYGVGVGKVDFRRAGEKARQSINGWTEQQTRGTIKDLLPPGILTPETALVLVNAIYFKGVWDQPFQKDSTELAPFQLTRTDKVNVPLMFQHDSFSYAETDTYQAVEMNYAGKNLSMVVLLPRKVDGLADLERSLDMQSLNRCVASLRNTDLLLHLPKSKLNCAFMLQHTLAEMGMRSAFSVRDADFSGMSNSKPGLYISAVLHKAFVEVNEKGTEAAAATAVVALPGAAPPIGEPVRPPEFRADHPFLFLIRETRTGSILFMGRVADPRS
jgi:serpin B